MSDLLDEKTGVLFMKVGTHANEPLDEIIERKSKEIADAGYALWGYGGNTCHPYTMVQPFARSFEKKGGRILLCMQEMTSNHFADQVRAEEASVDGIKWEPIPTSINVVGSRYALVIDGLRKEHHTLALDRTVVGVGNSQGRRGSQYIQGRVDKACLQLPETPNAIPNEEERIVEIGLVADIRSPYAVFLRNRR